MMCDENEELFEGKEWTSCKCDTWNEDVYEGKDHSENHVKLGDSGDEFPHLAVSLIDCHDLIPHELHLSVSICVSNRANLL